MKKILDFIIFISALIRSPKSVGAIAPSSSSLARRLASVVPTGRSVTVIELGAGNGCVTAVIADRIQSDSHFISLERDATLYRKAKECAPRATVICDNVANLRKYIREDTLGDVDAIVCGLPWANFDRKFQSDRLDDIVAIMSPDGVFTTFAYVHALPLPAARRFRSSLESRFEEVLTSSTVLKNLPPAITYVCRRPIR